MKVEPSPKVHLAAVCNHDKKCTCINDAIFTHDSSWATKGVGKKANNPCNMRVPKTWKPSVPVSMINSKSGSFAKFSTLADGITACVELYKRNYKHLPSAKLVSMWTAGDGNRAYRAAVSSCYL